MMIALLRRNFITIVIGLAGFTVALPLPMEDFDVPDVYSAVLPKYDFASLKEDLSDYPSAAYITSNVQNQLKPKNQTDDTDSGVAGSIDANILEALVELQALEKLLEVDTQYIENRKKEDSSWPTTLAAKVSSQDATNDEQDLFNEDLEHAISAMVLMKMMEERLSFINKYAEETIAAHPDTDLNALFGENEGVPLIQGLFELKYFEGLLHSVNSMIEETLTRDDFPLTPTFVIPGAAVRPILPNVRDDEDVTLGIGAFVVLVFTAIGFFFVLFLVAFLSLKAIRKCFEKSSDFDKKSKYEQI